MGAGFSNDDENDKTGALFQAIRSEKFQKATALISNGAGVNCINYFGKTPLIETCRSHRTSSRSFSTVECERERFVKFLINNDCDTSKYDIYGWTALMYAEKNGHDKIIDVLDEEEKDIDIEDSFAERLLISTGNVSHQTTKIVAN
ncbi:POTE ankyrin domain family member B-like [Mytilus trossulus]|uniref:POTE ankyrin domain family member B-like n=1 Tax=Mytilus trossulus TaxID=6551 RepID=UPI00300437E0